MIWLATLVLGVALVVVGGIGGGAVVLLVTMLLG